jgi:hypothetical protein
MKKESLLTAGLPATSRPHIGMKIGGWPGGCTTTSRPHIGMTLRLGMIGVIAAGLATAQSKPLDPLFGLRDQAEKAAANWQALADGLDAKVTRLLPCDPKLKALIEEVSRASEARMTAIQEYLRVAAARAKDDADAAQRMLAEADELNAQISAEIADAEQFRTGLETQMKELAEGAKRRASLVEPWKSLQEIAKAPESVAQGIGKQRDVLSAAWSELVTAARSRQTALEAELSAASNEAATWNTYYAARMARTLLECSITRGTTAPPAKKTPPRKNR